MLTTDTQSYPHKTLHRRVDNGALVSCVGLLSNQSLSRYDEERRETAKAKEKIENCEIAKKSPDLSAWGYAVWKDVSHMMRKQEQSSPVNKRDTRDEYLKRLKKALTSLPQVFTAGHRRYGRALSSSVQGSWGPL